MHAYTRAVSPRLADCALTHQARQPIDAVIAIAQHAAYEQALADCGCTIHRLPPLPDAPDAVFVEDTALLLDGTAVITRPGAASRAAETASVAGALAAGFTVRAMQAGQLDGGDVMRVGRTLYVGVSGRTDAAGKDALRDIVAPLGFTVVAVVARGCLHLKSGVTCVGEAGDRPILLINPAWVDPAQFAGAELVPVDPEEPWAANALRLGGHLLVAADSPRTGERLARLASLRVLDIGEMRKAEAALTCMSLIA